MPSLASVASYRKFINDRDQALEVLHQRTQKELSDIGKTLFDSYLASFSRYFRLINDHTRFTSKGRSFMDMCYHEMDFNTRMAAHKMVAPVLALRRASTTLSYAGELEAIARTLGQTYRAEQPKISEPNQAIEARLYYLLRKTMDKAQNEMERAYVQSIPFNDAYQNVIKKFPQVKRYKQPPRELKPIHEAATYTSRAQSATVDFISDDQWQEIVSMYKDEYVPDNRDLAFDVTTGPGDTEEWYGWEIEQDVTDDFCQSVKNGTDAAASDAGVTDLMWNSVLDDKTRPEHRLKNGLTSSEIEAKLNGEWSDFEDQATVAPSGFGCRCRSTPYVANMPEVEPVSYDDFNTWLNS